MIGSGRMQIKNLSLEMLSGKELRQSTCHVKDTDRYIVMIQKIDRDLIPFTDGYTGNCHVDFLHEPATKKERKP
jgi:hypothetical protein